jgi:hypothetical protein
VLREVLSYKFDEDPNYNKIMFMLAKNIIQITNGCPDISMLPWISKKYLYEERNVTN